MKVKLSKVTMLRLAGILCLASIVFTACTNDETDPADQVECDIPDVSFNTDVNPIIERSCAYVATCHGSGSSLGDFTTFETLQEDLDNGKFAERALSKRDMPPQYAPEDRPKMLENAEIAIIQCWADGGYQNN